MKEELTTGTEFTKPEDTTQGTGNGLPGIPLMSPEGAALAKKSAPSSAFDKSQIPVSPVHDKEMRRR
jgi:hypothetical protein